MIHRTTLILTVAVALCAVLASASAVAEGNTTITCAPCTFPYQQWVDEAMVPTPDLTLAVIEHTDQPGDCERPGLGCTDGETLWIVTWLTEPRKTFMHELGHVFALKHPELAQFIDERFADVYSLCARLKQIRPHWAYSAGEGLIPSRRLEKRCESIRETA